MRTVLTATETIDKVTRKTLLCCAVLYIYPLQSRLSLHVFILVFVVLFFFDYGRKITFKKFEFEFYFHFTSLNSIGQCMTLHLKTYTNAKEYFLKISWIRTILCPVRLHDFLILLMFTTCNISISVANKRCAVYFVLNKIQSSTARSGPMMQWVRATAPSTTFDARGHQTLHLQGAKCARQITRSQTRRTRATNIVRPEAFEARIWQVSSL